MQWRVFVLEFSLPIALAAVLWVLGQYVPHAVSAPLVVAGAMGKLGMFLFFGYRKLMNASAINMLYHRFILLIGATILLVVFSFSLDYFLIYNFDDASFADVPQGMTLLHTWYKFFFFSLMMFTNMGVVYIAPVSVYAEGLTMMEALLSFITVMFILTDFISLKDSLRGRDDY